MRQTLYLTTMLAAALLGSGVANAETLYASQYGTPDYTGEYIELGSAEDYDTLAVNVPLTLTGINGMLDLYYGATLAFSKESGAESICSIITPAARTFGTVYFNDVDSIFDIKFNDDAQAVVAASAGTPITLIQDLNEYSEGFFFWGGATPSNTTLTLNGAGYGESVVLDGVQFTYVGPQSSGYAFKEGEIGFTGYYQGSHNLSLVANGKPTPEPTTGTLSLLALAGLCARRRRK